MKVCIVTAFPPEKGNLAEYGYYMVKDLAKKEKVEEIVVLSNSDPLDDRSGAIESIVSDKVKVVRCWENNNVLSLLGIIKNIRKHRPDIVLFNSHMMSWGGGKVVNFFGASLPAVMKRAFGHKVVLSLHNIVEAVDFDFFGRVPSGIELFAATVATRMMLDADRVVVTLELYNSILRRKYGRSNIIHIPHGTFGKRPSRAKTKEKRILTFGFWRDTKDLPLLLDAFKDLKEEDDRLELVVAGKSHPNFEGYLEKIKKRYKIPGVTYAGYVPEGELDNLFGSASMVVLPYLTMTGSSGVVHLSASYGKPIVITDIIDIRKTTEEEGLEMVLYPMGDKEALKKAIKKLLADKKLRERMVKKNLRVAESLSFSKIMDRYVDVFEEVLKK